MQHEQATNLASAGFAEQAAAMTAALPHGSEFGIVVVFALTLAIGAATRKVAKKVGFPYTIAMLVLGILCGWFVEGRFEHMVSHFVEGMAAGGHGGHGYHFHASELLVWAVHAARSIKPDLIIFVFLPALIFESAYAIDLHTFKKTVGPAIVFAVPAMLLSTVVTGGMIYFLLGVFGIDLDQYYVGEYAIENGTILICMVVGALLSATDPVAVVALLAELGVSKKMSHLIEGESLLNDGTAIVVFTVLIGLAVGNEFDGIGPTLLWFAKVVTGGLVIGTLLAAVGSWWIGRTFNDPEVEISLTIALGYAAMFVAEGMFHVSGVMALVAAGLWLGGPGRTKVSPEVSHFLHHFWHLLAYVANTLIFFLVGNVMGSIVFNATGADIGMIFAIYFGILVIRFVITHMFRPFANMATSDPINSTDVAVISWGGLRGAVSVALVMIVAAEDKLPQVVRDEFLLITCGVVFLTIAVNGTTMGKLLDKLGYSDTPLGEQLAVATAQASVLHEVKGEIEKVKSSRDLRTVSWAEVEDGVQDRLVAMQGKIAALKSELDGLGPSEKAGGYWLQAVNIEREAYWQAFGSGTLGDRAVKVLDNELNLHVDAIGVGNIEPPQSRTPVIGGIRATVTKFLRDSKSLQSIYANVEFENLALQYDLSRAEGAAASKVIGALKEIKEVAPDVGDAIEKNYRGWLKTSKQRLEEIRINLPEVARAIETRLAKRIALNFEREGYEQLGHRGVIDEDTAHELAHHVEESMRRLALGDTTAKLPEIADLLAEIPLFKALDDSALNTLAGSASTVVIQAGEFLFKQGDTGDSMYVITRGAADVVINMAGDEVVVDVFGGGDILGEMSLLTGAPRTAGIRAATPVTLVRIDQAAFASLMQATAVSRSVWDAFAQRSFDNHVRSLKQYWHLDRDERLDWVADREQLALAEGDVSELPGDMTYIFVVTGSVRLVGSEADLKAPALVELPANRTVSARSSARVALLPSLENVRSTRVA
jgi:NhaP-type Na+/H+ or K+/H+ antiporter/CRP-like cAMP-binding protein